MNSLPVDIVEPLDIQTSNLDSSLIKQFPKQFTKNDIRTSLQASTADAIFASIFSLSTGGILVSNLLVELDATPVIFGMLSSIPMLVNFVQPVGAYISEQTTSRFKYSLLTFGTSRLLWLILVIGIFANNSSVLNSQQLVILTLLIVLFSHLLGGLGSASWLSWLAIIIPRRLRGRYFGIRNSACHLTNLICIPLAGLVISHWYGGTIQGYGLVLSLGTICGIISLFCQYFQVDVNPQLQNQYSLNGCESPPEDICQEKTNWTSIIGKNSKFLLFLLYFSIWMLAVHLSAPFFNFYLLDTLDLDVTLVTIYSSLQTGANLLVLILWGKLADRIGNRPILICVGFLVAITPLLWLGIGNHQLDFWLWLPLLHIFTGITWAGVDLCSTNMYLGIAPAKNKSIYFAIVAAVGGVSGALGTTIGGFIAQSPNFGGLLGLFALSSLCRLLGLLPLIFVQEPGK
ncbi:MULTISPECIES: MFS transporter [Aphanizomenon]|uniref:MFS transporter n=1 Tax=Aphanizomenon TaxID=1175 RepID=UPI0005438403|nr:MULTISPECIES: MFS transporter [Aphanizomenon]KHG40746.1 MFS transporter [Aphanizomenon flos-aquae 2012/KM1/D3]MTJ29330.1 MFS transporter [Aphanizomenon sp. UHCC 0183]QSV72990.1 MAG: MFS transporter [Aphanizomenon flos-aquae KM1D3_PB]